MQHVECNSKEYHSVKQIHTFGSTVGAYLATGWPSLSIKNFVKFHLTKLQQQQQLDYNPLCTSRTHFSELSLMAGHQKCENEKVFDTAKSVEAGSKIITFHQTAKSSLFGISV